MPDEAIAGGILRIIGSVVATLGEFLIEYVFERVGRIVIYVLSLGRVDTDLFTTEGINWLTAGAGFLVIGGLFWLGWLVAI